VPELNVSLTRGQVKRVLKGRRGAAAELARELGISQVSVSSVLKGRTKSARILNAATLKAAQILEGRAA
jgi:transcriptional regulator with XRE-family HTH domain